MMIDGGVIPVFAAFLTVVAAFLLLRWIKESGAIGLDDGKRYPPSLPGLPLFRAVVRGGMSVLPEHFMRSAESLGPVYCFRIRERKMVVLNSYEAIYDAMVKHAEAFADRSPIWIETNLLNPELRGIAFAHYNEVYKKNHKLSLSILKEFGFGVQSVSETRILQEVESMHEEILKHNGRPFDPKWLTVFSTSSFVLNILFGKTFLQTFPKIHSSIVEGAAELVANYDMTLYILPIVRFLPMFRNTIHNLRTSSERLLNGIKAGIEFNKSNSSESTFVSRFMEIEGAGYDHQDLVYILRDLCTGSTDTVSTTLQWAIVELANDPDVQNRFQKEIDETVPEHRFPSLDDKQRLPYTEAVILEVLRRHTLQPLLEHHATLKDTQVLGYDIPKGCMIFPNGMSVHMDPIFWKDPENFRPERFLDADNKIINSQRMIAFGLGKRSCIAEILGRQMTFLFLTSLVQRFDIRPPEGQKKISVDEHTAVTTTPSQFEVRMIPRVKSTQG